MRCRVCGDPANYRCHVCGADVCGRDVQFYTDESNGRISASARPECVMCCPPKYPRPYPLVRAIERGEWEL